jgi:hypothetical protein
MTGAFLFHKTTITLTIYRQEFPATITHALCYLHVKDTINVGDTSIASKQLSSLIFYVCLHLKCLFVAVTVPVKLVKFPTIYYQEYFISSFLWISECCACVYSVAKFMSCNKSQGHDYYYYYHHNHHRFIVILSYSSNLPYICRYILVFIHCCVY